jgi:hypothetical protein
MHLVKHCPQKEVAKTATMGSDMIGKKTVSFRVLNNHANLSEKERVALFAGAIVSMLISFSVIRANILVNLTEQYPNTKSVDHFGHNG